MSYFVVSIVAADGLVSIDDKILVLYIYKPSTLGATVNTLRQRQNGRHFADDTFRCIFLNENMLISIKISLKFVPKGQINNIPSLVQIMAWRWPGNKPLSKPRMESLLTHICVTQPQWFNTLRQRQNRQHFADGVFKPISFNNIVLILMKISLVFVAKSLINNYAAFVQIMAWPHTGNKPLSEATMA